MLTALTTLATIDLLRQPLDWSALAHIVWIDLMLGADNALLISVVAHQLPPHQRRPAIVGGALFAVVARVGATFLVASIIRLPGVRVVAGLLLVAVAFRLLCQEEARQRGQQPARRTGLLAAVAAIAMADLLMSMDNILAIAALSAGDPRLLVIGLSFSIIVIMTCGTLVARLLDRFSWLAHVGAAFLAWIAGRLLAGDELLKRWITTRPWASTVVSALFVVAVLGPGQLARRARDRRGEDAAVGFSRDEEEDAR